MRSLLVLGVLAACAGIASADDDTAKIPLAAPAPGAATAAPQQPPPGIVPMPAWSPRPPRPHPTAANAAADAEVSAENKPQESSVQFVAEALWDLAGYNNDEVIYTIFITSHDARILRCTTELKGAYYENGEKHSVSDRHSTTVFPEQRTTAGNWQGMDQPSGATYSVKCHPV